MSGTNQAANTSRRTNHFDGETEKERESRIANDIARSIVPAPLELSLYYRQKRAGGNRHSRLRHRFCSRPAVARLQPACSGPP